MLNGPNVPFLLSLLRQFLFGVVPHFRDHRKSILHFQWKVCPAFLLLCCRLKGQATAFTCLYSLTWLVYVRNSVRPFSLSYKPFCESTSSMRLIFSPRFFENCSRRVNIWQKWEPQHVNTHLCVTNRCKMWNTRRFLVHFATTVNLVVSFPGLTLVWSAWPSWARIWSWTWQITVSLFVPSIAPPQKWTISSTTKLKARVSSVPILYPSSSQNSKDRGVSCCLCKVW